MNTKIVLPILFAIGFATLVFALQSSIDERCTTTTYNESVTDLYMVQVGTYENGSPEYATMPQTVIVSRSRTECQQVVSRNGVDILHPTMQGYSCSVARGYAVCDSIDDGNGDGICDPRGGETCCRVDLASGETICKDGVIDWQSTKIPVRRLTQ